MKINRIFLLVVFILLVAVSYAYAGKVSQLPEATTMGSTDLIYKSEAGTTSKKITWANILSSIVSGTSGSTLQPYDADLVTLATPTAWRLFYSNGSQAIIELALGSDGTYLKSNGATSAPTWATPGGSGDVSKVGTPANYEFGIWTGDGTLKGLAVTGSKVMCTDANGQPIACTNLTDLAFSSYVDKALFDANTILAATSDNTPAAVTIAEQTVIGRVTSGNIDDLAIDSDLASVSANNDTIPSAKAVKNRVQYKSWSFDPDAVCDGAVDRLFLMSSHGGQGIIITQWKLSFEADPTTEADLDLKRADAWIGVANSAVMDVLDTTNGASSESTPANINGGAAIAEGKVIYLEFGTAYTETTHQIIFEMWYYEVGN